MIPLRQKLINIFLIEKLYINKKVITIKTQIISKENKGLEDYQG